MNSRHLLCSVAVILVSVLMAGSTHAERKRLSKPSERHFEVQPKQVYVGLKLTGGMVTGEIADKTDAAGGTFSDKLWYGVALDGDYFVRPHLAAGASVEMGWKVVKGGESPDIKLYSYALHTLYRFNPLGKRSVYLRPEIGLIKGTEPIENGDDKDLGSHTFLRFGLGDWLCTGPTTLINIEVYYKYAFSKDAKLFGYSDVDATGLGVDIGFKKGF